MNSTGTYEQDLRTQYGLYLGVSLAVLAFVGFLHLSGDPVFQPYFGDSNPLLMAGFYVLLGVLLFRVHLSKGWLRVYRKGKHRGFVVSSALAVLFGGVIIIVDLLVPFPADINVSFPQSLLFYPAIGFIVEIIFHLLPLTLLLAFFLLGVKKWSFDKIIWPAIIIVSLLEPVYQVILLLGREVSVYVALHIFLINLTQLWLFKCYDFLSMYLFRLVYYLVWHIGWGSLRLQWLFLAALPYSFLQKKGGVFFYNELKSHAV